ncbi:hypothetical protein FHP26_12300 [Pseudomonas orientalis]|nr:hypothetical protein [Pseudomonas orientalis]
MHFPLKKLVAATLFATSLAAVAAPALANITAEQKGREPEGGLALWVRFEDEPDVERMVKTALDHGLVVRSGRQFSPTGQPENALRSGFAALNLR